MLAQVLAVQWHERSLPIYSAHFSPQADILATGGQDQKVILWRVSPKCEISHYATLEEHGSTVNCVRWNHTGDMLATATDASQICGGQLVIWAQEPTTKIWRVVRRCLVERDIYDISWSPDGTNIATVGIDSKLRIFNAHTGKETAEYSSHANYVQGVAWDPFDEFIASLSMDKVLSIHRVNHKKSRKLSEMSVEGGTASFLDEKASNYFRRLAFSQDGNLLICPTAEFKSGEEQNLCTLVFTRGDLGAGVPSAALPLAGDASIAVACSPVKYKHDGEKLFNTPYACIYAVATHYTVLVYSTQSREPLWVVKDLHPSPFTDLTWSRDGKTLILSSMEGFCSALIFEDKDLPPVHSKPPVTPAKTTRPEVVGSSPAPMINMLQPRKKTN